MKRGVLFGLCLILVATTTTTFAAESIWGSITAYTSTKTNKTVPVSAAEPMKIHTTASTCTAHVDSASNTGVAIPANTFVEIKTPSNVSNLVFACTSSAGTTVTIIK